MQQMDQSLDRIFSALADPTRRAILVKLADGEASVGELAAPFNISGPAISRHLKVLEKANLISRQPDAQWRRCKLQVENLKRASDWISQYRKFWDDQLGALALYLNELKEQEELDNG